MMTLEQHREYVREKLRKWGEISRIMFRQNIEAALLDPKSIYSAMPDIEKMRARILYGYRLPAAQLTEDELLQIYRAMAFAKEIARDCLEDARLGKEWLRRVRGDYDMSKQRRTRACQEILDRYHLNTTAHRDKSSGS